MGSNPGKTFFSFFSTFYKDVLNSLEFHISYILCIICNEYCFEVGVFLLNRMTKLIVQIVFYFWSFEIKHCIQGTRK